MSLGRATSRSVSRAHHRRTATFYFFVATPEEIVALDDFPPARRSAGLDTLITYEVLEERSEAIPARVEALCRQFGIGWEPIAEPGHMRFLPPGAFMFARARDYASRVARDAAQELGIPLVQVEGVTVLDGSSLLMQRYAALVANDPNLYGTRPYTIDGDAPQKLLLRQTGCIQKFAVAREWRLTERSLPLSIFEISESYRREPLETLQLCARLRRFHLPEAHIHTSTIDEAVDVTLALHRILVREASQVADDVQIFVSASMGFASRRRDYFRRLASALGRPILVKVYPPGMICQDGVEVDVEYKIVDSLGGTREFSTFQIDKRITKVFGLHRAGSGDEKGPIATIHAVCTSSVERYIFSLLDRVATMEARGMRTPLPLWISPVVVRVIPSNDSGAVVERAFRLAREFEAQGIRADVDDRVLASSKKVEDADLDLVPYQILLDGTTNVSQVEVRTYASRSIDRQAVRNLVASIASEDARRPSPAPLGLRMSRHPAPLRGAAQ
jgi:threonyl-tRNA synthetase